MKKMLIVSVFLTLLFVISSCDSDKTTSPDEEYVTYNVAVSNDVEGRSIIYNITIMRFESDSVIVIDSLQQMEQSQFYSFQFAASTPEEHQINVSYIYNDETITHTASLPYENTVIHVRGSHCIVTNEECCIQYDISFLNETESIIDSIWFYSADGLTVPICKIENIDPQENVELSVFAVEHLYAAPGCAYMTYGQYFIQAQQYSLVTYHVASEITYHIIPYGSYVVHDLINYESLSIQFMNDSQFDLSNLSCNVPLAADYNYNIPDAFVTGASSIIYEYFIPGDEIPPSSDLRISGLYSIDSSSHSYMFFSESLNIKIHFEDDGYWVE